SRIAMTNSDNKARDIRFQEPSGSGTQYVGLYAPPLTRNGNYRFPVDVGFPGQVLTIETSNAATTRDSANLVWSDPPAGGGTVNTNASLAGDGSVGNPLGLNLANINTWTARQNFSGDFLVTINSRIAMTNNDNKA